MFTTFILYCSTGPGCFIRTILQVGHMLLLITHIIFILIRFFFEDAIALLRESCTFRLDYQPLFGNRAYYTFRSCVSSINLIKLTFSEFHE